MSDWETVEKAFKEKAIYQRGPLPYKWNCAKQKEQGMAFKEEVVVLELGRI